MQSKIHKNSFLFEVKAFEVVVRKSSDSDWKFVIGSQRVNKQSDDFRYD